MQSEFTLLYFPVNTLVALQQLDQPSFDAIEAVTRNT